ncbi:MAG TPA: hypothetical protein PKH69_12315 [Thiobacillaceae bacterium]|nr:hypothetical protein [Thiobacillaceae bacterium]HNU65294.1 hypothetical protein [Thiobacillaceae bacterium]
MNNLLPVTRCAQKYLSLLSLLMLAAAGGTCAAAQAAQSRAPDAIGATGAGTAGVPRTDKPRAVKPRAKAKAKTRAKRKGKTASTAQAPASRTHAVARSAGVAASMRDPAPVLKASPSLTMVSVARLAASVTQPTATSASPRAPGRAAYTPRPNPYLAGNPPGGSQAAMREDAVPAVAAAPDAPATPVVPAVVAISSPTFSPSRVFSDFRSGLPHIPFLDQTVLPKIQTVYPTGEKPLVVVNFKCPTELVGIDTPSTLILHNLVNGGMGLINRANLLSFNMQQVCR